MAERTDIATGQDRDLQEQARQPETVLRPPVDICEDAEGITLLADMPGVTKERLTLQIDQNTLVIEGEAQIDMPKEMEALYADVRSTRYRRSFTLSSELAIDQVDATLKDGVLTLRIPRRAEARPRKIEVTVH